MSTLVAISYPNSLAADNALHELLALRDERALELDDAVIVERQGGDTVKLRQSGGGSLRGALIALLGPLLGSGAQPGTAGGLDETFLRHLGAGLPPGHAAVVLLVGDVVRDRVLERLHGQYDGTILQTSLPAEADAQLRAAVAARRHD